ncbi:MAG: hypothetical protein R3Y16_07895 [Rikenellaceae bacterium]
MRREDFDSRDWSEIVADRLRGDEMPTPDGLWQRIEMTESGATEVRRWPLYYGVAAAAAAGVILFSWPPFDGGSFESEPVFVAEGGEVIAAAEVTTSGDILDQKVMLGGEFEYDDELGFLSPSSPSIQIFGGLFAEASSETSESSSETSGSSGTSGAFSEAASNEIGVNTNVVVVAPRHRSTSLSFNVGGGVMESNTIAMATPRVATNALLAETMSIGDSFDSSYRSAEINHRLPISFAVGASHSLSNRVRVASGLEYSCFNSDLEIDGEDMVQRLHFLAIPVRLDVSLYSSNHLSLYVGMGGRVERLLSAKVGDRSLDEKPWHYSLLGVVGAEYRLNDFVALYCEPDFSYIFTETRSRSIRNDYPITFGLNFGVRFSL